MILSTSLSVFQTSAGMSNKAMDVSALKDVKLNQSTKAITYTGSLLIIAQCVAKV